VIAARRVVTQNPAQLRPTSSERNSQMLQWKSKNSAIVMLALLVAIAAFVGNFTWAAFNFTW
jgi:hypothetical protein